MCAISNYQKVKLHPTYIVLAMDPI